MTNARSVFSFVLLLAVTLGSGSAAAEQTCFTVNSNIKAIGDVFDDPATCNGYEFCQPVEIRGTLNGTWWLYWNGSGVEVVAGGTALVFITDGVIETPKGAINVVEREIVNLLAPDGLGFNTAVVGGTDEYEGVTGWLAGYATFATLGGTFTGEICSGND